MEQKLATIIGNAAREARDRLDLNQREVAERVGIAAEVYGRLERGHMLPSVRTLRKLCLVLNCSSDALLGLTGDPVLFDEDSPKQEEEDPALRRLLKSAKNLAPDQLKLLGAVAVGLIKAEDKHKLPYYAG